MRNKKPLKKKAGNGHRVGEKKGKESRPPVSVRGAIAFYSGATHTLENIRRPMTHKTPTKRKERKKKNISLFNSLFLTQPKRRKNKTKVGKSQNVSSGIIGMREKSTATTATTTSGYPHPEFYSGNCTNEKKYIYCLYTTLVL